MSNDDFELVHGSGNVFRDFGHADADIHQWQRHLRQFSDQNHDADG